jgi:N-hydroxyarylamine O-acetyltransferase
MPDSLRQEAWLRRIGHCGSGDPTLGTLRALVLAHAMAIAYESIDVLLGRVPSLEVGGLQDKMIERRRGGYCFEQNMLFRAGLTSLGFGVTSLQARVIRGLAVDAPRPAFHMVLSIDLPEGAYLADVGFGNLAPTAPLRLEPDVEQATPHEVMRFVRFGDELLLEARLGERWEPIYRVVPLKRFDAEYEICNWFAATRPDSPYRNNLIAARPGPDRTRLTLFNDRLTIRHANGEAERRSLSDLDQVRAALDAVFGLALPEPDLAAAMAAMRERSVPGPPHPFFA